ncbi:hypothetical protein TREMEDRAFT_73537 [Tremella mesenterica DSM 1558]|uniref:uncharacterized protein n=1 Tax=Tremella mesenterica (strain ATCC 24925 / CBS 8224 / DSM 1558 / NBRC 9311 / NRRL Y-6157 / RJB 2259-6 / UBC 559-6) TaxID=578456 RepID=UPI0003F4A29E|nr:uncharacterized protein TREMEDRAFT_73537 [Tremella mesenterica DSM 1558]EIW70677.1 hypothetical protein TREMEDRAFT_73537 [Tremella mesenterica DSM 1558]
MPSRPGVTFESELRLRQRPSSPPSPLHNTSKQARSYPPTSEDFLEFLNWLIRIALSPITVPLELIHQALTSRFTVGLALRLILLGVLVLGSGAFSVMSVGAFWWVWSSGGTVETEGWLIYGSTTHRLPHALINLPMDKFEVDLRYDVQVEMELVRPSHMTQESNNFMINLELRSEKSPENVVIAASRPSLPPPPTAASLLHLPPLPTHLLPPCVIPWPLRGLCPSRLFGYADPPPSSAVRRLHSDPASVGAPVPLKKVLMEGVMIRPSLGGETSLGSAYISIGREDHFTEDSKSYQPKEVRTTGWVIVRFIPRPTGIRYLLASHPLPPLLLLPPVALGMTLASSIMWFIVITCIARFRRRSKGEDDTRVSSPTGQSEAELLAERQAKIFDERDKAEKKEAERRKAEWEEVESRASGSRIPAERKRTVPSTVLGGSETTAPTTVSFGPTLPPMSESESPPTSSSEDTDAIIRAKLASIPRPEDMDSLWEMYD